LPHVNCYPAAELRGGGGDGEATEHGNTARAEGGRYQAASKRLERRQILAEFVRVTGYHRKHALRMLDQPPAQQSPRPRARLYDEAVHQALTVLWEAADRICGKRLRVLIPVLIDAMERHGHLELATVVRNRLLEVSAATIDRLLSPQREAAGHARRRRWGPNSAIKQNVPVRTFADGGDPPPGYFECDLVEHCAGVKKDGNFVHTLTLTDIHSGWTECAALAVREQSLVVEGIKAVAQRLPFALRGLDTDNDSAFINETLQGDCEHHRIHWTRSRAYHKNDQAWVEQKNGAVVPSGRIRAPERTCRRWCAPALVRERPALCEFLSAIVQAGEQAT
jgi:hypothetical protein